jgi:hypothetical protein
MEKPPVRHLSSEVLEAAARLRYEALGAFSTQQLVDTMCVLDAFPELMPEGGWEDDEDNVAALADIAKQRAAK